MPVAWQAGGPLNHAAQAAPQRSRLQPAYTRQPAHRQQPSPAHKLRPRISTHDTSTPPVSPRFTTASKHRPAHQPSSSARCGKKPCVYWEAYPDGSLRKDVKTCNAVAPNKVGDAAPCGRSGRCLSDSQWCCAIDRRQPAGPEATLSRRGPSVSSRSGLIQRRKASMRLHNRKLALWLPV